MAHFSRDTLYTVQQDVPSLILKPKVHYRVYKSPHIKLIQAVMLRTYIQEVLGSNLGRDIGYSEAFCGFSQSLWEISWIVRQFKSRSILSKSFPIDHSQSRRFMLYSLRYHLCIVKQTINK
jgi:hypothetical protein